MRPGVVLIKIINKEIKTAHLAYMVATTIAEAGVVEKNKKMNEIWKKGVAVVVPTSTESVGDGLEVQREGQVAVEEEEEVELGKISAKRQSE